MTFREYLKESKMMTIKAVIAEIGDAGDVSDEAVVKYLKKINADDNLIADVFGYYHIPDEEYVDENGEWIK